MARVTVEDCVERIPNRFDLVMLAAQRSRDISGGAQLELERDNDKNPVVALREIADEKLEFDELKDSLVKGLQKFVEADEAEEEEDPEAFAAALLSGEPDVEDEEQSKSSMPFASSPMPPQPPMPEMPQFEDVDTSFLKD